MTGHPIVDAISKMDFSINVNLIPDSWLKHILQEKSGKPDLAACFILSDIVYWYRASSKRNKTTGATEGYKKRFADNMLQRSYLQLAKRFGLKKRHVMECIGRLRKVGVIRTETRNIRSKTGLPISNVMYIEPVPDKLAEITYSITPTATVESVSRPDHTPLPSARKTYTEITTETSTHTSLPPAADSEKVKKDKPPNPLHTPYKAWFMEQYRERWGPYAFIPRNGKDINTILAACQNDKELAKGATLAFFRDERDFVKGHSLSRLSGEIHRYIAEARTEQAPKAFVEQAPRFY